VRLVKTGAAAGPGPFLDPPERRSYKISISRRRPGGFPRRQGPGMPIYEYRCTRCGAEFEVIQKISDPPLKKCRDCGAALEKVVSRSSFQLKGSGWYVTDYARKSSGGSSTSGTGKKDTSSSSDSSSSSSSSESKASSTDKPSKPSSGD